MSAPLRLNATSLGWLHGHVPGSCDELDLDRTYSFEHELNESRELTRQTTFEDRQPNFLWHIEFHAAETTTTSAPVARRVYARRPRASASEPGPVAFNAHLEVRTELRRRGFARTLYGSEEQLYRQWGIREIQLRAVDDGLVVWVKRFGFEPMEPDGVRLRFSAWARRRGEDPDPPANPADCPETFLRDCRELLLWKSIA